MDNTYKTKNIVLDMDETLIHSLGTFALNDTSFKMGLLRKNTLIRSRVYSIEVRDVWTPAGTGDVEYMICVERPFMREFLHFCRQTFNRVIIWSAGRREYVDANFRRITRHGFEPDIVLTFDQCEGEMLTKPLAKLSELYPEVTLNNTFIIDDRETVFSTENPNNGFLIHPYAPSLKDLLAGTAPAVENDTELLRMKHFLSQEPVQNASDVRTLERTHLPVPISLDKKMNSKKITRDMDNVYSALAIAICANPIADLNTTQYIINKHAQDTIFRNLLDQWGDYKGETTAYVLRLIVVSVCVRNPLLVKQYVKKMIQDRRSSHPDKWMMRVKTSLNEIDYPIITRHMLNRRKFWGGEFALFILSEVLGIAIEVCDSNNCQIFETNTVVQNPLTTVKLWKSDEYYDVISATH